uniref:Uncharacterized protein n=1 Tax=Avena sativa TaxID=4498 RepID=A0ACD6AF74_AVESA
MVSWSDGDESPLDVSSDGKSSMNVIYDSDWCGLADDGAEPILCKCGFVATKFVGFEGYNTGRRFLSCEGQEELKCDFLQWVDPVPTDAMMKAVGKLWDMYGEVKQAKTTESLNFMEQKFDYQDKINKLHTDLRNSQDELAKQVEEKQVTLAHKAIAEQGLMDVRAALEGKRITDETTYKMHKCC